MAPEAHAVSIRRARREDVPALVRLIARLDEHVQRSNPRLWRPHADRLKALESQLACDTARVFVAEVGGEAIGCVEGHVEVVAGGGPRVRGFISRAVVAEGWRRRGTGTALVAALLAFFEAEGVEDISLRYVVGNDEAERFWQGLGFEPVIVTANQRPAALRQSLRRHTGP